MRSHLISPILLLISLAIISGCGKEAAPEYSAYDNTEEVQAYYAEHPERFVFSSIEELPSDLQWQNGSDLPTFGDPSAKRGGHLNLRLNSMQQTLRVVGPDANGSLRGPLWGANSVYLITRHPWKNGYIPGLAKEWALDPEDQRTVYLKLDPDARWSDGKPLTTEDILFSLYFLLSPHINQPAINRVYDENITSITKYDDLTFSITSTKPTPEPLYFLSTFILFQRDFYREFGEDYVDRYHWRFAPVTGAYTVDPDKVNRGQSITFERLENWWADDKRFYQYRFNPDKLTFRVIRDDSKAFEAFLRGQIDWHGLNRTELWHDRVNEKPFVQGYIERAWMYDQLPAARDGVYMNALKPLLDNRNIRLGIQHAINYEKANEGLFRSDRRRIRSFADGYGDFSHPSLKAREFDVNKAIAYFAKAGFSERDDKGILQNQEGVRLSFDLTVSSAGDDVRLATVLKEQAALAGLQLNIEQLDPTSFFTKTFEKNHQLALHGWNTGYSPLPAFEWEIRGKDAGKPKNFNTTNINDTQLDALLEQWDQISDYDLAIELSHGIQERVHEFAAWVPGLTTGYSRMGYWRWLQWPDYFQVPQYFFFMESGVFWIDDEIKQKTMEAQKSGTTFPAKTTTYERWLNK